MTLAGFFLALIVAVVITALFSYGFNARGPWGSFWTFFLVLFLVALAVGVWIDPYGPLVGGVAWVPMLIVALFFGLLLAAATPSYGRGTSSTGSAAVAVVSGFFWITLMVLLLAVIAGALI